MSAFLLDCVLLPPKLIFGIFLYWFAAVSVLALLEIVRAKNGT